METFCFAIILDYMGEIKKFIPIAAATEKKASQWRQVGDSSNVSMESTAFHDEGFGLSLYYEEGQDGKVSFYDATFKRSLLYHGGYGLLGMVEPSITAETGIDNAAHDLHIVGFRVICQSWLPNHLSNPKPYWAYTDRTDEEWRQEKVRQSGHARFLREGKLKLNDFSVITPLCTRPVTDPKRQPHIAGSFYYKGETLIFHKETSQAVDVFVPSPSPSPSPAVLRDSRIREAMPTADGLRGRALRRHKKRSR